MKTQQDREDDLFVLFGSILSRINRERKKRNEEQIVILDKELNRACEEYTKKYGDFITFIEG